MKLLSAKAKVEALTLIEAIVVIAMPVVLAALLLPSLARSGPSRGFVCLNNLKQLSLITLMYSQDYSGQLPWQELRMNSSAVKTEFASSQFKILSGYYKHLPALLVCPLDKAKTVNTNLETLTDQNISYFLNIDTPFTNHPANTFFSGDRNLWVGTFNGNGFAVKSELFVMRTNYNMSWTHEIHLRGGNLAFADGHVQFVKTNDLNNFVQMLPLATNRLCIP